MTLRVTLREALTKINAVPTEKMFLLQNPVTELVRVGFFEEYSSDRVHFCDTVGRVVEKYNGEDAVSVENNMLTLPDGHLVFAYKISPLDWAV